MSFIKDLATKFAINQNSTIKESQAVTPIFDADQLKQLTSTIDADAPEWLSLWFHISIQTAGRTTDIASLRFSNLNYQNGQLAYVVAKQSKAARARAVRKALVTIREKRQNAADDATYRLLASTDLETLAQDLTPQEETIVADAVASAKVKVDKKVLSPALTKRIQAYQESTLADADDYMFPASITGSNRAQALHSQPVSRQTVWRKIKPFMEKIEQAVTDVALHLSAYSTRKIAAYWFMKKADAEHPGSGLAIAMERLGHSSVEMTRRYLGLDRLAEALQRKLAGWAA